MGVGGHELRPGCQHPHHRAVKLDPDLDMRRRSDRVDPVGPVDAAADLLRQMLVHKSEKGLRFRDRQFLAGYETHGKVELIASDFAEAAELGGPLVLGQLVGRGQHGDFLRGDNRKAARYPLPMLIEEDECQNRLQDDNRRDDDNQRPRIKALWRP